MTTKLKLVLAVWCLGALTGPVAMAQTAPAAPAASAPTQTQEFVAETPNVPQLSQPTAAPRNSGPFALPEPGSLPLALLAAAAAVAVARRRK